MAAPSIAEKRALFLETEKKIKAHKIRSPGQIDSRLKGYVLFPYLYFELLLQRLKEMPHEEIEKFYEENKNSSLSDKLNYHWMHLLSQKKNWKLLLADQQPSDNMALKCLSTYATQMERPSNITPEIIQAFWNVPNPQPSECDQLFSYWLQKGMISHSMVLDRIELAANNNKPRMVLRLGKLLPNSESKSISLWYRIHMQPHLIKKSSLFNPQKPMDLDAIIEGIKQISKKDIPQGLTAWKELKIQYTFSKKQKHTLYKSLALLMFNQNYPMAEAIFNEIPIAEYDQKLRVSWIKSALRQKNWKLALKRIESLPEEEQNQEIWTYWKARSLAALDDTESANALYQKLSGKISYYGVLSCEQMNNNCSIPFSITIPPKSEKNRILKSPSIQRAIELYQIGRIGPARLEWSAAVKNLPENDKFIAASIAEEMNWHDRALTTAAKYENLSFLYLQYPLAHEAFVFKAASLYKIDPAWIFAVSRQESIFMTDARSPVGALGVMQLMPTTARRVAKQTKIHYSQRQHLFNLDVNIRLGTAYLRDMLNLHQGNAILATAAYNAGPSRVRQWLEKDSNLPADIWIELVPFTETQNYVKKVTMYTTIYQSRLGKENTLREKMLPIQNFFSQG